MGSFSRVFLQHQRGSQGKPDHVLVEPACLFGVAASIRHVVGIPDSAKGIAITVARLIAHTLSFLTIAAMGRSIVAQQGKLVNLLAHIGFPQC